MITTEQLRQPSARLLYLCACLLLTLHVKWSSLATSIYVKTCHAIHSHILFQPIPPLLTHECVCLKLLASSGAAPAWPNGLRWVADTHHADPGS
mmetsp:Transcript_32244/g.84001  ORF Transcript_32244/g.84001 Transcript_32244/m.84001 type:complete len:94 (+) Transcript_32244:423-704(+)